MRFLNFILIIFLILTNGIKADVGIQVLENLKRGGNLIFIRHAYAPGGGDPDNFDINDCLTQRNLSEIGRNQSKKIGEFFKEYQIPIDKVISSEWCRCKETALIAFSDYETESFLNSFFSENFRKNKDSQIKNLKSYVRKWDKKNNLILVTHYVLILEILDYAPSSGEIIISDSNFKLIGKISHIK